MRRTVKAVSFSLYGNEDKYCLGAIRNAQAMPDIYPGWRMVVWADETVPMEIKHDLMATGNVMGIFNPVYYDGYVPNGMFWRYLVNDQPDVERWIARDCDSIISHREAVAVNEWIALGKPFHAMRDHFAHARPCNGGMIGCVAGVLPSMRGLIQQWAERGGQTEGYGADQEFLGKMVWPLVEHNCVQHDAFHRQAYPASLPFSTRRDGHRFVGEVWNYHDGQFWPRLDDITDRLLEP